MLVQKRLKSRGQIPGHIGRFCLLCINVFKIRIKLFLNVLEKGDFVLRKKQLFECFLFGTNGICAIVIKTIHI